MDFKKNFKFFKNFFDNKQIEFKSFILYIFISFIKFIKYINNKVLNLKKIEIFKLFLNKI
jgi:hypothetical protein